MTTVQEAGTPSPSTAGTCGIIWQQANPVPQEILGIWDVAYGGGQFVATAGYPGGFLTSPDGITWTWRTLFGTQIYEGVIWGGNQFVAVGLFGSIRTSPNGITWTWRDSTTTLDLWDVTWNGSQYVAVVGYHLALTSPDGVSWTQHVALGNELRGVAWGANQFVAVGKAGTILTSLDGANWTWLAPVTTQDLYDVTWGGNQFVAVGNGSLGSTGIKAIILTSPDGVNWTWRDSGTTNDLKSVVYNGNQFVAVGLNGTILTSVDGVTWIRRNSGTTNGLYGVTYGGNQFVAVGGPSIILTSRCDNPVTVTVRATDATATEAGPTTGTFTFTRSGDTAAALTVGYTVAGTATTGSDYTALGASVSFPAGVTTVTKTVAPRQDALQEPNETVVLTLAQSPNYAVGTPGSATVILTSDEPITQTVAVRATDATATEAGPTTGTFTFTRSGDTAAALTVGYTVAGTATTGSDYTALGASVSFPAGVTTVTKTVTPRQDALQEPNETVVLTLAQSPNYAVGTPGSATVILTSDEPITQTVAVRATDATATEAGPTTGTFTFTRSGDTAAALTVGYTVAGTATTGSDYTALGASVSFPAGVTTVTKTVTPRQDALQEPNETVVLTLAQSPNYAVGTPGSATVILSSDE
jgi:hypothetical protein